MPTLLGSRIRELREALDISLREFAKKLGDTSPAHISDIELGRRNPSESLLKQIAQLLRVPFEELQKLDMRPPVDELRRAIEADPQLGFALRKVIDHDISSEDLLKLVEKQKAPKKTD